MPNIRSIFSTPTSTSSLRPQNVERCTSLNSGRSPWGNFAGPSRTTRIPVAKTHHLYLLGPSHSLRARSATGNRFSKQKPSRSKNWAGFFWQLAVLMGTNAEIRFGSRSRLRLHNIIVLHTLAACTPIGCIDQTKKFSEKKEGMLPSL